jgi:mRNA interferase RelE/StbE
VRPADWHLEVTRQAERDLERLPPDLRRRILDALPGLTANPPMGDIAKPQGRRGEYRLRVGDWRVIIRRDRAERAVVVTAVRPRGGAYRD